MDMKQKINEMVYEVEYQYYILDLKSTKVNKRIN